MTWNVGWPVRPHQGATKNLHIYYFLFIFILRQQKKTRKQISHLFSQINVPHIKIYSILKTFKSTQ